jgi:hypothetical protein
MNEPRLLLRLNKRTHTAVSWGHARLPETLLVHKMNAQWWGIVFPPVTIIYAATEWISIKFSVGGSTMKLDKII